jgi:uncharacterized zinc-type alcohol dehydrogenase-like protein
MNKFIANCNRLWRFANALLIGKENLMTIHAYAAMKAGASLETFSYEPKPLGPFDVEVSIDHCGICHSDVHLINNDWQISEYPLIPGHEIIGAIAAKGDMVAGLDTGRRVGIGWPGASCPPVRAGYGLRSDRLYEFAG